MNAITSVLQRVQQAILELPCNQLPYGGVFQGGRPEVLDRSNLSLGKNNDLNFHG
jgi:hypothetical protein